MFEEILHQLLLEVPGARGAIFCDPLGESVSCAGRTGEAAPDDDDYRLKLAGAHLSLPYELAHTVAAQALGAPRELTLFGRGETLLLHALPDGYYVVLCLSPGALVSRGMERLRRTARRLAVEI